MAHNTTCTTTSCSRRCCHLASWGSPQSNTTEPTSAALPTVAACLERPAPVLLDGDYVITELEFLAVVAVPHVDGMGCWMDCQAWMIGGLEVHVV